jgi:hypothetical protein
MPIAALLLAAAVSQTPPDSIFHDGYDAGGACPATINGSTGPLDLRERSDIIYLPDGARVRHNVDVTQWDNIWGHIDEVDDVTPWPGVPGASPTIHTVGKTEYIGARFHVPLDAPATLFGKYKHVVYGGGPNVDATISRTCGDFEARDPGCWVQNWESNDNFTLYWRINSTGTFYCNLVPGNDYFLNLRFSDPETTGPNCRNDGTCQMTFQQQLGGF